MKGRILSLGLIPCFAIPLVPADEAKQKTGPVRVLLFADGPMRDFQLVRHLFVRQAQDKQAPVSVLLQAFEEDEKDQFAPFGGRERILSRFPGFRPEPAGGDPKGGTLTDFDVVIAFDPDWTKVGEDQIRGLRQWLAKGGGLILVGGLVNGHQLAGPRPARLTLVQNLYPVKFPQDFLFRQAQVGLDTSRPYLLRIDAAGEMMGFLRLEDNAVNPLACWDHFFWGAKGRPDAKAKLVRGFHTFVPVESVRRQARVIAWCQGPEETGSEHPFLVTRRHGAGIVVYLNVGETWRFRQFRNAYFDRFWTGLVRFAAAAGQPALSKPGLSVALRPRRGDSVIVEAYLVDGLAKPLPATAKATMHITPPGEKSAPVTIPLNPLPARKWTGWFGASFQAAAVGDYRLLVKAPALAADLSTTVRVQEPEVTQVNLQVSQKSLCWKYQEYVFGLMAVARQSDGPAAATHRQLLEKTLELLPMNKMDELETFLNSLKETNLGGLREARQRSDNLAKRQQELVVLYSKSKNLDDLQLSEKTLELLRPLVAGEENLEQPLAELRALLRSFKEHLEAGRTRVAKGPLAKEERSRLLSRIGDFEHDVPFFREEFRSALAAYLTALASLKENKILPKKISRKEEEIRTLESLLTEKLAEINKTRKELLQVVDSGKETPEHFNRLLLPLIRCDDQLKAVEESLRGKEISLFLWLGEVELGQRRLSAGLLQTYQRQEADLLKSLLEPKKK